MYNIDTQIEGTFMCKILIVGLIIILSGCSLTPPAPPSCQGEFQPVNQPNEG